MATNLWPNPSAATDLSGVATDLGAEGSLTRDVSGLVTSFHLSRTSAGGNPTNLYNLPSISGFVEGDVIWVAADILSPDTSIQFVYQLVTFTSGDSFVASDFATAQPITGSYVRYTASLVAPATTAKAIVGLRFEAVGGAGAPNGTDVYLKNIWATRNERPPDLSATPRRTRQQFQLRPY